MSNILWKAGGNIVLGFLLVSGLLNKFLVSTGFIGGGATTRRGESREGFLTLISDTEVSLVPYLLGVSAILYGFFILYKNKK